MKSLKKKFKMEIPGNADRFLPAFVNSVIQQLEDVKILKKRFIESQEIIMQSTMGFYCPQCKRLYLNEATEHVQCGIEDGTLGLVGKGCGKWLCIDCWHTMDDESPYTAYCSDCSLDPD